MSETSGKQVFRTVIRAPIDVVWRALTKEGEALPFFFGSVLHTTRLAPGAPIRMRTPDGKYTAVVGDVLEVDPPRRYAHTMRFTSLDDPPRKVSYELREVQGGVELTLTTEDVPPGTKSEGYMKQGGKFIVDTLKAVVETGKPPLKSRMILLLGKLMAPFTPKRCRSENWPLESAAR